MSKLIANNNSKFILYTFSKSINIEIFNYKIIIKKNYIYRLY